MGTSRFVFIVFQLVSLSAAQPNFLYYFCINNNGNYTNNSTYKSNLNTVLSSITSNNNISYGFYNFSAGREPDQANGIALCRGDVTTSDCHSCLNDSTSKLTELCPNQKEAIGWYVNCMLRYTNRSIFGVREDNPRFWMWNLNNASDPDQFSQRLGNLLSSLQSRAASGGSHRKFATGEANASSFQKIYALMQCTPDLSLMDCYNCLGSAMSQIPSCCNGKQGGRVIGPSCALRFETSIFYESADAPSPSPPEAAVSPPLPSTNKTDTTGDHRNTFKVIIIVAVPTVLSVSLFAFICFCFVRRRKARRIDNPDAEDEIGTIDSLQFNFETIRAATGNFSETNKLGQGGFGAVYKGKLSSGEEVAVKRLAKNSGQGEAEFKNEILLVAKLQHRNLVRLLGFCLEGEERLLIYEFVANNSLDHYIFDAVKRRQMDWETRYKIIGGIARGLLYLHEDSQLRIIHRDLKASNILLDSKMNPKISDFGVARLVHMDQSHSDTVRVVGTYGYMAPEYALHGLFSVKSDVYSFGVLVLEIISGQRISEFFSREHVQDLITYAWRKWREGTALEIVDPVMLAGSDAEIMRCIHIGLLCVQEEEADRPTMSSVTTMLSSDSVTVPMPSRPAYVVTRSIGYRSSDAYLTANSRVSETHHAKRNSRKIRSR